jgi:hypothetical protein
LLYAIGFFSLQALSSGHGAAYLLLASVALIAWRVVFGMPLDFHRRLRDFGAAGAYLLAPAVWVTLPYRLAQQEAGLRRGYLAGSQPGIESFLATPAWIDKFLIAHLWGTSAKEADAFLFPGVLVLVLAAIAILGGVGRRPASTGPKRARFRENYVAFYLLIAVLATMMFIDRPFELWRYVYWLPGLNFIRVPSRFILLTLLALSVLAGFGFDRITSRLSKTGIMLATATVAALLLIEYSSYPFGGVPYAVTIPPIDRWLDTQPKPFVVAELPVPSPGNLGALERQQTSAMLHATAHWQKTIHGYSGIRRPFHDQLYLELTAFPDATSLASLRGVGVNYVVVHTAEYGSRWPAIEAAIARTPALTLEHVEGDGRVYAILSASGATRPTP